ncbi:tetratricopeptide repeat protein [Deinococcus aerolatus]|uniref:tetratricopeptide repeat protein n=1 Tax=Deinococcus aerolatus TaxID=522487 RepID=UPI001E2D20B8|nr:tetratricopeptide repeat protein [Deinococcus aerolatus]
MDYKAVLADLRAHLPPGAGGGAAGVRRGSLRWLETQMRARGAGATAVRNIIYRDIGTAADRETLRAILAELAAEVGRPLPAAPAAPASTPLPAELELLGRSKKRAYRQFLAGVRAGRAPRLIVTGRAGAGKTVLLDSLDVTLRESGLVVKRLFLSGDVAGLLGLEAAPGTSYAQLAAAQSQAVRRAFPASGTLLVRVTDDLAFAGGPPRSADGSAVSAARWAAEHLLHAAPPGLAVLLALELASADDLRAVSPAAPPPEVIALHPPTPAEARGYLMARLGVPRAEADLLVAETGRHLDRLSLLVRLRGGGAGTDGPQLLTDPDIRRLAAATAALEASTPHAPAAAWSPELLRAALGAELRQLPPHARALLAGSDALGWTPTPALRAAWTGVGRAARAGALARLAGLSAAGEGEGRPVRLAALAALEDWPALAAQVRAHPDDARWLPPLWPAIRHGAADEARDDLAGAVVRHHAGRGEYHDSGLRDALFTLLEAARPTVRAWARVKLAESSLEAGNMDAAAEQLAHPDVSGLLSAAAPARGPWAVAACADALLLRAALARWAGDLDAATRDSADPRAAVGGPRAWLWRGLIAKDAGRWDEALGALASVPPSSPLLSARARYQEGDLRLRLGQPAAALTALRDAAARLETAGAGDEERARVLARSATALRRLGRVQEAHVTLGRALALLPPDPRRHADHVPRARLLSEALPVLLALGRPDDALAASVQALALLGGRSARPAEVQYRQRRTRYRVALVYLTRGLGGAYLQPLLGPARDHPDLRQARSLLDGLIDQPVTSSDRDGILLFDMHLSRALADPDPAVALTSVDRALALAAHPYEQAQARAMRAEVQVRLGRPADALAELNRAHALLRRVQPGLGDAPDPGLQAQLLTLEATATLADDGPQTLRWLRAALADPALAPFHAGVWRALGRALEEDEKGWALLRELHGPRTDALTHLRPGDALWLLELGEEGSGLPEAWD